MKIMCATKEQNSQPTVQKDYERVFSTRKNQGHSDTRSNW